MSSPSYVTQNEYPLDDDTTLMSTTDLHSYMTHTNDTFVQVSGYSLKELLGQPHLVRHPDMPKRPLPICGTRYKRANRGAGLSKTAVKMATTTGCVQTRCRWCVTSRVYVDSHQSDG
jgi:hypothetical protein